MESEWEKEKKAMLDKMTVEEIDDYVFKRQYTKFDMDLYHGAIREQRHFMDALAEICDKQNKMIKALLDVRTSQNSIEEISKKALVASKNLNNIEKEIEKRWYA